MNDFIESTTEAGFYTGWESLKEYLGKIEDYFKYNIIQFEARIVDQEKTLGPDEILEFKNDHVGEIIFHYDELPYIIRNSFLVSCYSLLEIDISRICGQLKDSKNITSRLKDYGDLLENIKSYFKLAGIDITLFDDWQEIEHYSELRNCIVHRNGVLNDKKDQKAIAYCKKNRLFKQRGIVTAPEESEIGLSEEFAKTIVNTMQKFILFAYEKSVGR